MQELAVCLLPKVINLLPPTKGRHKCFGHADFEINNFKMILSIFDGPNSEPKNANHFFPDVFAARHISDIFWVVKLAPKFLKQIKTCVK